MLGLPAPALVRVALEGPTFDPQVTNFDTFASPTGDYSVPVIADKDGQFTVTALAFPPIALPLGAPGLPTPIDILPPVAQSPSPPIVVGDRRNGTVIADGQSVPVPQLSAIEISAQVVVSPIIPITIGAPGGPPFGFPPPTGLPPDEPGPPVITITPGPPAPTPAPAPAPAPAPTPAPAPAPAPAPPGAVSAQIVGFTIEG